jgi:hypothetical protein
MAMVQRSLTVFLSLNEEMTLRRIVLGVADVSVLPDQPIARLRAMGLLDDANRLTPAGGRRYENLARPQARIPSRDQKLVALLVAVQKRAHCS